MSLMTRCDGCGQVVHRTSPEWGTLYSDSSDKRFKSADLCPACYLKTLQYIHNTFNESMFKKSVVEQTLTCVEQDALKKLIDSYSAVPEGDDSDKVQIV